MDAGLRQKIRHSTVWRKKDDLLRSVPSVGEQVSLTLLDELPELGVLGRKQIAALVLQRRVTIMDLDCDLCQS